MPMKPGTVDSPADSLTESIEHALRMEWLAVKGKALPQAGAEDLRLLLAAIAQGLLDYLKDQETAFKVLWLDNTPIPGVKIGIEAPKLTLVATTDSGIAIEGEYFGSGSTVTVSWDEPHFTLLTKTVGANRTFAGTGTVPSGAAPGEHVVVARDDTGHAALAVFQVSA